MLTDLDRALLAMEHRHYRYDGAKATAVRAELGLTMTGYWQRLFALCDRAEALAEDPVLVNRINRRRRGRVRDDGTATTCPSLTLAPPLRP